MGGLKVSARRNRELFAKSNTRLTRERNVKQMAPPRFELAGSLGLKVPVFSGGFVYRYPSLCRVGAFTASGTSEEAMPVEGAAAAASLLAAPVVAEANDGLFCG